MIHLLSSGSLFESPARVLVCPVNCVGVMGKGLALEFARWFPGLEGNYRHHVSCGHLEPGECMWWRAGSENPVVVLFPTKVHWRDPSQPWYIFAGLGSLVRLIVGGNSWTSVAIPALGCGLGGLSWSDVRPMIEMACGLLPDREFYVYAPTPSGAAAGEGVKP